MKGSRVTSSVETLFEYLDRIDEHEQAALGRACPACDGEGEVRFEGLGVSPFSGVLVVDPQCEEYGRCPVCGGSGERP